MAIVSMSLVDGLDEMVIYPRQDEFVLELFNPGSATPRVVTENRVQGDGELDNTAFFGGRTIALDLMAIDDPAAVADELSPFTHPGTRPYLVVRDSSWAQDRRLRLRAEPWSAPWDANQAPHIRNLQAQWRVPDGTWEAAEEETLPITVDVPSSVGRSYPRSYPRTYAATSATGSIETVNVGSSHANFRALLYGPISGPRLINNSTGEELAFKTTLTLSAGQYVEVDIYNKTAYLGSDTSQPRLTEVDWDVSTWWQLRRGLQSIRYAGTDPGTAAKAIIYYRPVWL